MLKFFLFPRTSFLAVQWWHRLATVCFWGWLCWSPWIVWKSWVLEPWESCISRVVHNIVNNLTDNLPIEEQCGTNALNYFWGDSSALDAEQLLAMVFLTLPLYALLSFPALVYRLLLYIAKGSEWKDRPIA